LAWYALGVQFKQRKQIMTHFDNPNRVRLLSKAQGGVEAGVFVAFTGQDIIRNFGDTLKIGVLAARPIVHIFEGADKGAYYDPKSTEFRYAMQLVKIEHARRRWPFGTYGLEVAVEIEGLKYIMPFCSASHRAIGVELATQHMDRRIILEASTVNAAKFVAHTMVLWVKANSVQTYSQGWADESDED
jgi:hypothetical protein